MADKALESSEYKVAIASTDGETVNQHYGKAEKFYIYSINDEVGYDLVEERQVEPVCMDGAHEIAKTVAAAGAKKYNIIPLIPTAKLADEPAPTCQDIHEARAAAMPYIELFLHCNHCPADAVGVPGRTEFSKALYANFGANGFKENFSHG